MNNTAKTYSTKQKCEIIEIIRDFGDKHFTAEEVKQKIQNAGGTVGISTVYRNLDKLVKEGTLQKYASMTGESACYRMAGSCCEHFHLKCISCGKLEHLSCAHLEVISEHVLTEHGFSIDASRTVFYGLCRECAAK